ncbi:FliM/FliN family flagellar motor switch protein [Shimia sp.]|uniref:FliM/FliN family flagellar motor switch protein n=1 Tax=Shimia sp. TaxID=1954381 RepID=UPI003299DBF8
MAERTVARKMDETGKGSILRRKASEGRQDFLARSMSPDKAMRLALERAAEKGLDLALEVLGMSSYKVAHDALSGHLDSNALLAVLDGADGEPAAVSIGPQVLGGLVEHQTIGRIIPRQSSGRMPTRVDAALITPFLDDAMARFVSALNDDDSAPKWLQLYRFGAMAAGPRTLSLALTAHEYHLFQFDVSLAGGAKQGQILICFPECKIEPDVGVDQRHSDAAAQEFRNSIMMAPTALRAVLTRISLPITQLQALSVGDVLPISSEALKDTILETTAGEEISRVHFGQVNGLRAIRLSGMGLPRVADGGDDPEFVQDQTLPPTEQDLDDLLAAETALDALLPPVEDDASAPTGFDEDLSDLDELIQLSADDIGDPTAMARLGSAQEQSQPSDSTTLGDGV